MIQFSISFAQSYTRTEKCYIIKTAFINTLIDKIVMLNQ